MITQLSVLFYPSLFELIVSTLDLQKKGNYSNQIFIDKRT